MKYQIIIKHLKSGEEVFNEKCDVVICGISCGQMACNAKGYVGHPPRGNHENLHVLMAIRAAELAARRARERYHVENYNAERVVIEDGYGISDLREEEK